MNIYSYDNKLVLDVNDATRPDDAVGKTCDDKAMSNAPFKDPRVAIIFDVNLPMPKSELAQCVRLGLTYHLGK